MGEGGESGELLLLSRVRHDGKGKQLKAQREERIERVVDDVDSDEEWEMSGRDESLGGEYEYGGG